MSDPKILVLDIETSPNVASVWGLYNQTVSLAQVRETSNVILWAAKWVGKSKVHTGSDHHDGHTESITRIHALIDQADYIVTYNGKNFDRRHLNREFLLADLTPPRPAKDIDLLLEVRRNYKFASGKLDHVASELGLGGKIQTGGMSLWNACVIDNNPKAWDRMRKYCAQDVKLTEKLFHRLKPWLTSLNVAIGADGEACTRCGSRHLQRRGWRITNAARYRQYQCQGCGAWVRSKRLDDSSEMRHA